MEVKRYPIGCKSIDDMLGGGFESGTVTQLYGEGGTGKTNICIQLAVERMKAGEQVIYIDTEGLSEERFRQIAGNQPDDFYKRIIISKPSSFEGQSGAIHKVEDMVPNENVGVVILDSATVLYRYEYEEDQWKKFTNELGRHIAHLLILARKHDIAVIITNQVYSDDANDVRPTGGTGMDHLSKAIIKLERIGNGLGGVRKALIRKHRSIPEGSSCEFVITSDGVRDIVEN